MEPERTACAVRKASSSDLLAVVQLIDRSPGLTSDRISNRQRAIWERMTTTSDLTVYVAETGSEIVGTASMLLMPHVTYDCHPTAFIEAVLVAESHRRQGVGQLIVKRILDDARAASCRKVQLLSHKRHASDGAHDFYRSLGFKSEAEGFRLYLDPRPQADALPPRADGSF